MNTMNKNETTPIPGFDKFACVGDSVTWKKDGYTLVATLHPDNDAHVDEYEVYSKEEIRRWKEGHWFFGGLVVDVYLDDALILPNAASLWGLEVNLSDNNDYLRRELEYLEAEALEDARERAKNLKNRLEQLNL